MQLSTNKIPIYDFSLQSLYEFSFFFESNHILGSPEIWSDKEGLLHIKGTQRGGGHGGERVKTISRSCQRHKEQQRRSVRVAESSDNKRL